MAEQIHRQLGGHAPIFQRKEQVLGVLRRNPHRTTRRWPAGGLDPEDVPCEAVLVQPEDLHLSYKHF